MIPPTLFSILCCALGLLFHWVFFILALISLLDVFGRYQEYKTLRAKDWNGMSIHMFLAQLKRCKHTYCQRSNILLAMPSGMRFCARQEYKAMGYRWYNLLPNRPLDMFKPKFWLYMVLGNKKIKKEI